jgi:hypothetical protein
LRFVLLTDEALFYFNYFEKKFSRECGGFSLQGKWIMDEWGWKLDEWRLGWAFGFLGGDKRHWDDLDLWVVGCTFDAIARGAQDCVNYRTLQLLESIRFLKIKIKT